MQVDKNLRQRVTHSGISRQHVSDFEEFEKCLQAGCLARIPGQVFLKDPGGEHL